MIGLGINGVRPRLVPARGNWLGLRHAIECDHCKGRRMPNGDDDRSQADVDAGLIYAEPFRGDADFGVLVALLAHVAFQHSTLPVREVDVSVAPPPPTALSPRRLYPLPPPSDN